MDEGYKYVVFSPYFGKLPNYFQAWLDSCKYNREFKFVVFTDDNRQFRIPENVKIVSISFHDFIDKLCSKLDITSNCRRSYKLCDFKPTYGYTLSEYLDGCLYWGHCDLDLVFGNLSSFLPHPLPDKLSKLGHFCLYRNCKIVNEAFMHKATNSKIGYKEILSSSINFAFDEIGEYGINTIFEENGLTVGEYNLTCADISSVRECMAISKLINGSFRIDETPRVFKFLKGRVFSLEEGNDGSIYEVEYSYVHLQKREMLFPGDIGDEYLITYNSFEKSKQIDVDVIRQKQPKHKKNRIRNYKIRIKNMRNKILLAIV